MNAQNDNRTLRGQLEASLAVVPESEYARRRRILETRLREPAETLRGNDLNHTDRAYGLRSRDLSKPSRWVEPSESREDALLEARRFAMGLWHSGFAFRSGSFWYAADERPGIADEVIAVERKGDGSFTETNEGGSAWR